jgi:predicted outer membrane lipoprotein
VSFCAGGILSTHDSYRTLATALTVIGALGLLLVDGAKRRRESKNPQDQ